MLTIFRSVRPSSCSILGRGGGLRSMLERIVEMCLPDEDLKSHHSDDGDRDHHSHEVTRRFLVGVGHELGEDHPDHGPRREAQSVGQKRPEDLDEKERGHRHKRLGQTGEDAPACRTNPAHPARHEDQADSESLWYVVDGQGKAYEQAKGLTPAERYPYAHPFGEGVYRHDPDYEQRLAGVKTAHTREDHRVFILPEGSARDHDERQTEQGTHQSTQGAVIHSLVEEAEARREHQPGRDGVGGSEPPAGGVLCESEGHGAEPGGNRREQREEKDRSCAHWFHTLYTTRSRFRPRAPTLRSWPVDRPATAR